MAFPLQAVLFLISFYIMMSDCFVSDKMIFYICLKSVGFNRFGIRIAGKWQIILFVKFICVKGNGNIPLKTTIFHKNRLVLKIHYHVFWGLHYTIFCIRIDFRQHGIWQPCDARHEENVPWNTQKGGESGKASEKKIDEETSYEKSTIN